MLTGSRIFVAGHRGLIGSAITSRLLEKGYQNLILKTRDELDLNNQDTVQKFFAKEKPEVVFLCAAKVGGIQANNTLRADFIHHNTSIQNNVIWNAHESGVKKLIFLGSSCIYPRDCPQPMREEYLLTGPLEYTNRPYALAKIAGMELVNALNLQYGHRYFSVMPTNLYGPRDQFDLVNAHVLPALIRKFLEAKESGASTVTVWGSGKPKREFLYSLDCADAIVHLAETVDENFFRKVLESKDKFFHINVGSGAEVSIGELAAIVQKAVGFTGKIVLDATKPDGTPRKLLDTSLLFSFGWRPKTGLDEGVANALAWYKENRT